MESTKNYLQLMSENVENGEIRYISPELVNLVEDNNFYYYDKEKSDVFILAMLILEAGNLQQVNYFQSQRKVNLGAVVEAYAVFKGRYSHRLSEVIERMLDFYASNRPRFEELIDLIEHKIIHTDHKESSKDSSLESAAQSFNKPSQ